MHIKSLKIWDNKALLLELITTWLCSGLPGGEVLSLCTIRGGFFLCSSHYRYPICLDVKYKRGISFHLHTFKMQCPNIMLLEKRHLSKKTSQEGFWRVHLSSELCTREARFSSAGRLHASQDLEHKRVILGIERWLIYLTPTAPRWCVSTSLKLSPWASYVFSLAIWHSDVSVCSLRRPCLLKQRLRNI